MSLSSNASLGGLRLQAQQRADMENSQFVSTAEWNLYISQSYKELYDLLVAAYGNDYYVQTPYQFALTGALLYTLPSDFYKLLGIDLQYTAAPNGWITLQRFEFIERNKWSYSATQVNWAGRTNLRYKLLGNQILFNTTSSAGTTIQVWYIPEPTPLCFIPIFSTTATSQTLGCSDVSDMLVGMTIYGNGIPANTTITAIGTNTITISNAATISQPVVPLYAWIDSSTLDGISGWEEYIVIDAAMKAMIKEESDVSALAGQLEKIKLRIESMSEGRDAGQAQHVSDVLGSTNGYEGNGFGDGDFGGSGFGGGW